MVRDFNKLINVFRSSFLAKDKSNYCATSSFLERNQILLNGKTSGKLKVI